MKTRRFQTKESVKIDCEKSWEISIAKSFQRIEAMREIWQQIQSNQDRPIVSADIDRYISVVKSLENQAQPYVILLRRNDCPIAMIIGLIEKRRLDSRIGYKTLVWPPLRCLTVIYNGVIGQASSDVCAVLMKELLKRLKDGEADVIYFNHLPTNFPMYRLAKSMPNFLCHSYFSRIVPHWYMSIPENIDHFYQARSPKHRKHLKQYSRKLENAFPGQIRMITYSNEGQLDEAIRVASQISAKTYQFSIGCGFVDDFRTRTLLSTAARLGWLRAHILYINEEPAAFRFALKYSKTYFSDGIGFDPKWKEYRVGTILFLKVLENLCRDHSVDSYDLGFGNAEYKQSYGDKKWEEASICVFANRPYTVFINILYSAMAGLSSALQFFVSRLGVVGWVKRRWRNKSR